MATIISYQELGQPASFAYPSDSIPLQVAIDLIVPVGANYKVTDDADLKWKIFGNLYTIDLTPEGDPTDFIFTPNNLTDAKNLLINKANEMAEWYLSESMGLVIRELTLGTPLPADIAQYRTDIQTQLSTHIASINGAADVAALEVFLANDNLNVWPTRVQTHFV